MPTPQAVAARLGPPPEEALEFAADHHYTQNLPLSRAQLAKRVHDLVAALEAERLAPAFDVAYCVVGQVQHVDNNDTSFFSLTALYQAQSPSIISLVFPSSGARVFKPRRVRILEAKRHACSERVFGRLARPAPASRTVLAAPPAPPAQQ